VWGLAPTKSCVWGLAPTKTCVWGLARAKPTQEGRPPQAVAFLRSQKHKPRLPQPLCKGTLHT